ncbi:hypothetical protein BU16DRAFT_622015 [Lophium mytilinum]|uniref:Uncharacterized protein n=1 Tax=Lophium mytilinum TaxID=390894 RepID=A0A6A6QED8_9PEZI|nr:hypothetical protein BU16DRAFT_622015 [Lophium mytilinum]
MRFTSIAFALTAFLSAFVAAAPTTNDITKRLPTPEEFEALAPAEKRKVYTSWYRATNILPTSDDEWCQCALPPSRELIEVTVGSLSERCVDRTLFSRKKS